MRELKGKVAVVTGAASGIGRAMAERFAREGMKVVLADVEEAALHKTRDALAATGAHVLAVRTDVSKAVEVEALAKRTFEELGAAHIVCNNAGVAVGGLCWTTTIPEWEWVMGVNFWGVLHGIRAFVPRMIEQGEGHVVNTASMAGLVSGPTLGPYCATKHAVVTVSECLHHDLAVVGASGVKVSVVCPAWVKTNISDSHRNRPADASLAVQALSPQAQMIEQIVRSAVASGIPPEDVADQVYRAVIEERFWVLTHPMTKPAVSNRTRDILEGRIPEFDPLAM